MVVFRARGHPNIRARHRNTLEFTREPSVTLRGDCIVGVSSTFDPDEMRGFASRGGRAVMRIKTRSGSFEVRFVLNRGFSSKDELVVRRSGFISPRTLGMHADAAASDMPEEMRQELRSQDTVAEVLVEYEKEAA